MPMTEAPLHNLPVTILGGYLGAGKTTFINRLLASSGSRRIAVLVNDFGAISVDEDLISNRDGQTMALANGCVCCAVGDSLSEALEWLASAPVDAALLETSGVALPAKVAAHISSWPGLALAGVVTLVDALAHRQQRTDRFVGQLVQDQVAQADLVLATKTDRLDRSLAQALPEVTCEDAQDWPLTDLLTLTHQAALNAGSASPHVRFYSASIADADRIDAVELRRAIGATQTLVRIKGWYTDRCGATFEVQQVGDALQLRTWQGPTPAPATRLCAIGTAPLDALAAKFQALTRTEPR